MYIFFAGCSTASDDSGGGKVFIFQYGGYCTVSVMTVGTVEGNSRIYLGTVEGKRGENGKDS